MKLAYRTFEKSNYYITSPYGMRIHPITKKESFHNGCDYGTHLENWNQYALEDGEVSIVRTGYKDKDGNGLGNYVRIKYPRIDIELTYGHLKNVYVKKGQKVNHQTIIGTTGTTGNSTGIHLHLGLQKINKAAWLDPEKYDYEEEKPMIFNLGDTIECIKDTKLYTTVEQKESKYTIKKGDIAYVKCLYKNTFMALANPDTKEYFISAWTKEVNNFKLYEEDYKKLYEEEVEKNKILQDKINKALEDLK